MTSSSLAARASRGARWLGLGAVVALLGACATQQPYDYVAFKQSRPASLLVLPPVSTATDLKASPAVMSQVTLPLAEAGYYVLPVTLVDETFKQNGLTVPDEIHGVAPEKLREIFGADAAVYLRVTRYGTTYNVISSVTMVAAEARIVDLRSGQLLWQGQAAASSAEGDNSSQGGLVGLLVKAVVNQIVGTATDASYNYAGLASQRLLGAPRPNGVLYGPRSPNYQKD
ncbi:DUF799 domain-containing protein [Azohydromonas australica]|uniref:DUF799 domain-containing protein n=1 Tax=Azohydromonas australica TaxID=364039 RepID=UPI00041AAD42|nr:DUF799 domain-containing protein [Azohydromonas australica]